MRGKKAGLRLVKPAAAKSGRRRWKRALLRLALAVLLLLMAYAGQALFRVREINLAGAENLEPEALLAEAGLRRDVIIFLVNEKAAELRLEALPLVRRAAVTRRWPWTVTVTVEERKPAAYLLNDEGCWSVDREGIVIAALPAVRGDFPVITGAGESVVGQGRPLSCPERRQALALFLQALEGVPGLEVAELNLADPRNLVIYTIDRREILLGDSENLAQKLTLVWNSLPYLAAGRVGPGRFDVRTGDRLIVPAEEGGDL